MNDFSSKHWPSEVPRLEESTMAIIRQLSNLGTYVFATNGNIIEFTGMILLFYYTSPRNGSNGFGSLY